MWMQKTQIMIYIYRILKGVNSLIDWCSLVFLMIIILYSGYTLLDEWHVDHYAEASSFEEYAPGIDEADSRDFKELINNNPDVTAWLKVNGTPIDYPVTHYYDNLKYINTDIQGKFSMSGSIFLDYRNSSDFSDRNNIIYGHHMKNKAMFGSLEQFSEEDFFMKHSGGSLYFDDTWHNIEFFAFGRVNAYNNDIYNVSDTDIMNYVDEIRKYAIYFRETAIDEDTKLITLSTCSSGSTNERYVLTGRILDK